MRLIDADELWKKAFNAYGIYESVKDSYFVVSIRDIINAPTIDAVPVVRCKECKHGHPDIMSEEYTVCRYRQTVMPNDGFCSYGERRTDD